MSKVYIVTAGSYSDYHICRCFSTKEKAYEYIETATEGKIEFANEMEIEEYELDENNEIGYFIYLEMKFNNPFSVIKKTENNITYMNLDKDFKNDIEEYIKINKWSDELTIKRIVNPNKSVLEEEERIKKIAYDTVKRINYLYNVQDIHDIEEMNKMINKK